MKEPVYLYDVFISHSPADREWVDTWLLPRLEGAGLRVAVDYRDFIVGMPRIENIERSLVHSRRTIVVLTPQWLAGEWNAFEALLLRTLDPAARQRRLLPVLLQPCDLPDLLAALEKVDLTAERHWEKELRRLTRDIEDTVPVPVPWQVGGAGDWTRWRRWLRRYRRPLRWGALAALVLWVLLFTILGWPPFQPRLVWQPEPLQAPYAMVLHNTGSALVVGAANVEQGCNVSPKGLWYRPLQGDNIPGLTGHPTPKKLGGMGGEAGWRESDVGELLCIEDRDPPALSDIAGVASLPAQPDTVYALTSHTGILVSTDAGATFSRLPGPLGPPRPAPLPPNFGGVGGTGGEESEEGAGFPCLDADNRPARLVLSEEGDVPVFWLACRKDGLFVYRGEGWSRLDGNPPEGGQGSGAGEASFRGCAGLPNLTATSLLVTRVGDPHQGEIVVIGSEQRGLWLSTDGGRTCRRVFDAAGRFVFWGLWDVSPQTHSRYLALVQDTTVEPGDPQGTWRLLDLCPRPGSCTPADWRSEPKPLWHRSDVVADVFVRPARSPQPPAPQPLAPLPPAPLPPAPLPPNFGGVGGGNEGGASGDYEWFLVTQFGQVWRGDLSGAGPQRLPGINRCRITGCNAAFAAGPAGGYPYLLAATIVDRRTEKLLASGRVYYYAEGAWWRRLWP